ncbi:MAG: hypothetical protein HOO06_07935 [Bdellovibrionaceae bacterium]|nr:hypothetical protein [Pseudobdellovibrionaceae bacterium]
MKNFKRTHQYLTLASLILFLFLQTACSQHVIEAEPEIDSDVMLQNLEAVSPSFYNIANEETTMVYYAQNGSLGTPSSVLAFIDLSFIANNLFIDEVVNTQVYFLDSVSEDGRDFSLLIHAERADGSTVSESFVQTDEDSYVEGDTLYTTLSSGSQNIRVSVDELVDGSTELDLVIQLHVETPKDDNSWGYIGKISTLIGYGSH